MEMEKSDTDYLLCIWENGKCGEEVDSMQAKKCKITLDYRRSQTMPQNYSNDSSIVYELIFQIKNLCIVDGPNHSSRKCYDTNAQPR